MRDLEFAKERPREVGLVGYAATGLVIPTVSHSVSLLLLPGSRSLRLAKKIDLSIEFFIKMEMS